MEELMPSIQNAVCIICHFDNHFYPYISSYYIFQRFLQEQLISSVLRSYGAFSLYPPLSLIILSQGNETKTVNLDQSKVMLNKSLIFSTKIFKA